MSIRHPSQNAEHKESTMRNVELESRIKEIDECRSFMARNGWFFASSREQEKAAESLCESGELRRVSELLDNPEGSKETKWYTPHGNAFYVYSNVQCVGGLPYAVYNHLVMGVPC